MDTFDLRAYLNENRLLQEQVVSDDYIAKLVAKVVKKDSKEVKDKTELGESLAGTIGLLLPAILELTGTLTDSIYQKLQTDPSKVAAIKKYNDDQDRVAKKAGIGTWGIKWLDNPFNDSPKEKEAKAEIKRLEKEKDAKFGTQFGKYMVKAGHKLHALYTKPIKDMIAGIAFFIPEDSKLAFLKDEKTQQKIANILYAAIMIFIGVGHVVHDISHFHGIKDVVDAILNTDKVGISLKELIDVGLKKGGFAALLK